MRDPLKGLLALIAGTFIAVSVAVIMMTTASPIPVLGLLSLIVGFVAHLVLASPDHHGS
jgi:uncharacterized membrane protein YccC